MPQKLLQVDPCTLRLPPSRKEGADDFKLARQVGQFGSNTDGMPLIEVTRGKNGLLMIKQRRDAGHARGNIAANSDGDGRNYR